MSPLGTLHEPWANPGAQWAGKCIHDGAKRTDPASQRHTFAYVRLLEPLAHTRFFRRPEESMLQCLAGADPVFLHAHRGKEPLDLRSQYSEVLQGHKGCPSEQALVVPLVVPLQGLCRPPELAFQVCATCFSACQGLRLLHNV